MKRTPWFNAQTQPPVRDGWYEFRCSVGMWPIKRLYFRRGGWFLDPRGRPVLFGLCDRWRGLLKGEQ